jgi:hypothetical protein
MCWVEAAIGIGSALLGSRSQRKAADKAVDATLEATRQQIGYQRESRDLSLLLSEPYRQAGTAAQAAMMDMMGLPRGVVGGQQQQVSQDPNAPWAVNWARGNVQRNTSAQLPPGVSAPNLSAYPEYQWQTDPGYEFRLGEGQRAIERSAAARGGLLSGGTLKDTMRFGQDMASNEYMKVYNRLATLAGYGQVGAQLGTSAIMNAGQGMSNAIGGYGATRASAYAAQGNINAGMWGDIGSVLGNLPWDQVKWGNVFGGGGGGSGSVPGLGGGYGGVGG